ncbi:thiolase family protein [Levilactobacillus brevis]|uniref:acetyl-CoA C-acetyltransferase n=1 Tax=Levilactobacillus brevis TaxID=1580 RepID=B8PV32_LEVBR|nr:acetyl-CoA C-acetyltransferase [Levilactobacillus brevis]ABY71218.1 acetyl coA synthetase [Levilactobacillus brevis]MBT9676445.1 acetyl-CoA C-acyltransferase [Levilactobacillus brevis]MCZ2119456.1 acetyl-CoA C-acetyltransferase [Levilactobacillus brevis]MCZ2124944.1 acetyl-CoA C-acetyltransferase [Levilactobacillus brevis]MCZ2209263.1 acetyl-CoA C-acetyltransferase [Levilactobacillus brevis]
MAEEVVIVSAARTPIGKFGKSLRGLSAEQLGTIAAKAAITRSGLDPATIQQTIFGSVLQAGQGQNIARQIELNAGLPVTSTAMTINQVCGSSLKAIRLGQSAILMGDADIVLVGGTESMSNAPYLTPQTRWGHKFGDIRLTDSLAHDGLTDAFTNIPMGITAENVAAQFHISRADQDAFALRSQRRATAAQQANRFADEIVPVSLDTTTLTTDEAVRTTTSREQFAALRPAFKSAGTVTAGNAAGLNDGAAAMILMKKSTAQAAGIAYLATLRGYQEVGIDPAIMGYAPVTAIQQLLTKTQRSVSDIDRFELNEAFAAQSVAVGQALALPDDRLNVNGGAIALGHPLGASGTRIVVTLLYELLHSGTHLGVASMCIGGGMGMALMIESN